jgi:hypothetical protein
LQLQVVVQLQVVRAELVVDVAKRGPGFEGIGRLLVTTRLRARRSRVASAKKPSAMRRLFLTVAAERCSFFLRHRRNFGNGPVELTD